MLHSNDSETARNPQKGAFKPQSSILRDPQDESGLGYQSPLMGGGEIATGFSPYNQYQTYTQPPGSGLTQHTVFPKDMQANPIIPVSLIPMSTYVPNTSYSAPAATAVIAPPAFAPYQQTFGSSTEIAPSGVYRAHHIGSGTATPEGSTFAGSTLPPASFSQPPPTFNNSFSAPMVIAPLPTSLATSGLQQISAPVSTAAYVPSSVYSANSQTYSMASAANSSPSASHHSYSYSSGSVAPSSVALSRDVYAPSSSMSTTTASPSLASSAAATTTTAAAAQSPLTLHRDSFDNGITSTVAVKVPDSVPEDQYLAYVLAQQQYEQSLTSAATATMANTPMPESPPSLASLPRRPNMQARPPPAPL